MASNKKRWIVGEEPDNRIFAVCDFFFDVTLGRITAESVPELTEEHSSEDGSSDDGSIGKSGKPLSVEWMAAVLRVRLDWNALTRERIYPCVREGMARGYVVLHAPSEYVLARRLAEAFPNVDRDRFRQDESVVTVVNARGASAHAHVAAAGADHVLSLIRQVGREKKGEAVHIGLGPGTTAETVARRLGQLLNTETDCPDVVIHAIASGGFALHDPLKSPITFFRFFETALVNVDYVGLFSEPLVDVTTYTEFLGNHGVQHAFNRRDEIDIVLMSFGSADDHHGLLTQFVGTDAATQANLEEKDWVGDVQFLPYAKTGPIELDRGIRAVTLFELEDLVEMAKPGSKRHVVLLAGPCAECGALRTSALLPLLRVPELNVWNHLVTDMLTASQLLQAAA